MAAGSKPRLQEASGAASEHPCSYGLLHLPCVVVCSGVLQCVAVCCSALQCGAVWCSVLQCAAVCCSVWWRRSSLYLSYVARSHWCCSLLQCVAVCCSVVDKEQLVFPFCYPLAQVLQCVAARRSVLQCVAVCFNVLRCGREGAVCCSVLQCDAV